MAAGRPALTPGEGNPLEIVVDSETELLVPPHDAAALAAVFDIREHARAVEAVCDAVLARPRAAGARA